MATALDQLIAAHDATHREYARAISRGDKDGAASASRDLTNLGEQLDTAATNTVATIKRQLSSAKSMEPALQKQAHTLGAEAAELARLAGDNVNNTARKAELEQSSQISRDAVATAQAAFIIFVTMAVAFVTGYYRITIAVGIFILMVLYKPFSASDRWQSLYNAV